MTALAIVGTQKQEPCVYCRNVATFVELKWRTSDGSRGTSWRVEPHRCAETAIAPLVEFSGEEDVFLGI